MKYLRQLSANNNRPWFQEHREEFDELRVEWFDCIDRMITVMSPEIPGLNTQDGRSCSYRIYRDTRFSLDKTPYKTYFSALISPYGRKTDHAAYYIQAGSEDSGLYGGLWHPTGQQLRKLRAAMVDNIEELQPIIDDSELNRLYPGWCGEMLKTIPKGWERNHPQAELLRLKDIGRECPLNDDFFNDPMWPERAAERLLVLRPLIDFLNYSLDE